MTVMTRERFARMLDPYIFKVYELVIERGRDYAKDLFNVNTSKLAEERVTGIGAADLPKPWSDTGQVYYSDVDPLWDKVFRHDKWSLGIKIEKDLWDDAQHAEVKQRVQRVIDSHYRFRQLHAHSLLNNAFDSNYPIPDGKPLCATDHPASPDNTTLLQSNLGTAELDVDSLEETRIAMMMFKDDKGKELLTIPDLLIVPPALEMRALEIVRSAGRPDTSDRADNVRRGAYEVLTLPLLTNSKAWFLVDSKRMMQFNLWFDRRKPVPERAEDFDTEVLKWKLVTRFSYGTTHWAWIYGNNPDLA